MGGLSRSQSSLIDVKCVMWRVSFIFARVGEICLCMKSHWLGVDSHEMNDFFFWFECLVKMWFLFLYGRLHTEGGGVCVTP